MILYIDRKSKSNLNLSQPRKSLNQQPRLNTRNNNPTASLPSSSTNVSARSSRSSNSDWCTSNQESESSLISYPNTSYIDTSRSSKMHRFDVDAWISSTLCIEGDKINWSAGSFENSPPPIELDPSQVNLIVNDESITNQGQVIRFMCEVRGCRILPITYIVKS